MANKWDKFTNQNQWKNYIQQLILYNDRAYVKAVLTIYSFQTQDEKLKYHTSGVNKLGFGKPDAEFMSEIAECFINGRSITRGNYVKSKNKIKKYWRQLMLVSKGEIIVDLSHLYMVK